MSDEKHICPKCNCEPYICGHYYEAITATITTTCPRCSATIDPAAVEQHHERCFVAGDRVRWWPYNYADNPNAQYIEGRVAKTAPLMIEVVAARNFGLYDSLGAIVPGGVVDPSISPGTIRHIQRPGPSIVAIDHNLSPHASDAQIRAMLEAQGGKVSWSVERGMYYPPGDEACSVCRRDPKACFDPKCSSAHWYGSTPTPPAATLYDGMTAEQCLELMVREQREDAHCNICCLTKQEHQLHRGRDCEQYTEAITPAQLAAARDLWQQQLRARISAAKERERLTVCMPIDSEDLPW